MRITDSDIIITHMKKDLRVLVLGAHPDDPDVCMAGTAVKYSAEGATVRFVSLTNGDKGHRTLSCKDLASRRKGETAAAARALGIESYVVLDHPDCELEVTLDTRREVTRLIRSFAPHVVFTHRTCDYHADHRACATLVMDAAYLLGVPHWCPDVPVPDVLPVVFYMRDRFTVPRELRPDVVVDVSDVLDKMADGLLCHESQVLEWLPPEHPGAVAEIPRADAPADVRRAFIRKYWFDKLQGHDVRRFSLPYRYADVFELSEYGRTPDVGELRELFPEGAEMRT